MSTSLFTPDGRRLVIGLDRLVCVYEATTGAETAELGTHEHRVFRLAISPDDKRIASQGDGEHEIHLWDGVTGREVAGLRSYTASPGIFAFSPDGARLASGAPYPDNGVRL